MALHEEREERKINEPPTDVIREGSKKVILCIASWLNERVNRYPTAMLKIALLFTGPMMACLCGALIVVSVKSDRVGRSMLPDSISNPQFISPKISAPRPDVVFDQAYRLGRFLDSLKNDSDGRNLYDSIVVSRPGLEDSIRFFLEQFQEHHSN